VNIIRFEIRRNLRAFLIWTAAILAFVVWMLSVYESSFSGLGAGINEFTQYFPESMKKAFGIDRLDLTTITGWTTGPLSGRSQRKESVTRGTKVVRRVTRAHCGFSSYLSKG
jgi:hypothetical protein